MSLIEYKNVSIGYGKKIVLENVSFRINPGDVVFNKGVNGSGKSTLLKAILKLGADGLFSNGEENYWLPSTTKDFNQTLKREICFAEQEDRFGDSTILGFFSLPFEEGVRYCPYGDSKKEIKRYILDYLSKTGVIKNFEVKKVKDILNLKIKKLSGGQRHIVSIFSHLIGMENQAKLFIFDEPLNHLDYHNAITVLNKITTLHREHPNAAIIICSHCMSIPCVNKCFSIKNKNLLTEGETYFCHDCYGEVDENGLYVIEEDK